MFVFMLFPMTPGVEHNNDKNDKAQREENYHPGPTFPDLLNATRKLGPIHVSERYTFDVEK